MFGKIVVPLDGSECADRAFELALTLAKSEPAELAICSIVDPMIVAGTAPPSPAMDLVLTDRENEARRLVDNAVRQAQNAGVRAHGDTSLGVPFDEILRYAKHQRAGAIVMGTHGRTGLKRFFLGSVAESVLRGAQCPVVVIRDSDGATR